VTSLTAVYSGDFVVDRPSWLETGYRVQVIANGNFALSILATDGDNATSGNFIDVSTFVTPVGSGAAVGANITKAGFYYLPRMLFNAVRINVTSVQAGQNVNLIESYM
jgi:hypothetical protein